MDSPLRRRVLACFALIALSVSVHAVDLPKPADRVAAMMPPRVYCFDGAKLAAALERVQSGDAALQPSLDRLRREADEALQIKPMSVMDKTRTPPSGNKHDYVSQAPYFWPDPTKPNGLPYIRKDGERNPEVDRGTDRPAIGRLFGAVNTLALAYYFTGRQAYAEHAAQLVRTWFLAPATRMNPHFDYAQYIPGINNGRGIGLIEMSHFGHMCDDLTLIQSSGAWTKADDAGFRDWLTQYFAWLTTSKNGTDEAAAENNHGTWYDVQVSSLALYLGKTDFAQRTLSAGLKKRLEFEIEPSGAQPRELARTKSLGYSTMNLDALFTNARLADRVGVDWWNHRSTDGRSLHAALNYLAPFSDPTMAWRKKDIVAGDRGPILALVAEGSQRWSDPDLDKLVAKFGHTGENAAARWHLLLNLP
jgi:hypothetical protein